MVVAVSDDQARGSLGDLREHAEFVGVGRGHRDAGDHPRQADPHVHPEAVEGLLEEGVLAESRFFSTEAFTPVGASEEASRQGHRVADGEGWVVRSQSEELLPEVFLDCPEIGRLPREGGAVHFAECGEPLAVMTPEVTKDRLVGVHAKELSHDLDGEDLCVRKFGQGTTRSEGSLFD